MALQFLKDWKQKWEFIQDGTWQASKEEGRGAEFISPSNKRCQSSVWSALVEKNKKSLKEKWIFIARNEWGSDTHNCEVYIYTHTYLLFNRCMKWKMTGAKHICTYLVMSLSISSVLHKNSHQYLLLLPSVVNAVLPFALGCAKRIVLSENFKK